MKRLGFNISRFGIYFFIRSFLKYNSLFLFPGISIDFINGFDIYIDIEVKFLFFGIGIRFIFLKKNKR